MIRTLLLRILLKIAWSVGGHADQIDGLPRVTSSGAQPLLQAMEAGDFVLLGNNGLLTHVAVYVGQGNIVHAMATEKTMRGWWGSLWDALGRMFGSDERKVGVVREALGEFLERYERDTIVVSRIPNLGAEQATRGLSRIESLIGLPYDYGFKTNNEAWYCTELVQAFLDEALGKGTAPIPPKRVRVPLLLDEDVIEPEAVLKVPGLSVVLANAAARSRYQEHLGNAVVTG